MTLDISTIHFCTDILPTAAGIFDAVGAIHVKRKLLFENFDEAIHGFDWMIPDMTRIEQLRLHDYLERHLIRHSDGWTLDRGHVAQWAVLSWHLCQQNRQAYPWHR